jgi:fructokinase
MLRIGVDLGGTKIEAVALAEDGSEVTRVRVPSPRSYPGTLHAIAEVVARVEDRAGETGSVGVGIPGAISPRTGRVKNANSTWLIGHALDVDLAQRLDRPVRLQNDANCFTLSEAVDGAGAGAEVVFGVILGTGVGGGIAMQGRLVSGAQLIAGEWGHNPLPWPSPEETPGPPCYCGLAGCIETFLSGPGMERDHKIRTGEELTTHEIAAALTAHYAPARNTFARYVDRLARGLATVINVLDPNVVVLGGGMSNLPDLANATSGALPPYVFTDEVTTRVRANHHGDSSGVRGAAWLWS